MNFQIILLYNNYSYFVNKVVIKIMLICGCNKKKNKYLVDKEI